LLLEEGQDGLLHELIRAHSIRTRLRGALPGWYRHIGANDAYITHWKID